MMSLMESAMRSVEAATRIEETVSFIKSVYASANAYGEFSDKTVRKHQRSSTTCRFVSDCRIPIGLRSRSPSCNTILH